MAFGAKAMAVYHLAAGVLVRRAIPGVSDWLGEPALPCHNRQRSQPVLHLPLYRIPFDDEGAVCALAVPAGESPSEPVVSLGSDWLFNGSALRSFTPPAPAAPLVAAAAPPDAE